MKHTYPLTEIMLILLFCVIIPIGLPVTVCCFSIVRECFEKPMRSFRAYRGRRRAQKEVVSREKAMRKAERTKGTAWVGSDNSNAGSGSSRSSSGRWDEKDIV